MTRVLIINGHQPYPFAKGELNATLTEKARVWFERNGDDVRLSRVAEAYDVDTEVANHQWAALVFMQFPVNWMGVPWSFKKYIDEVYSAGMDGRMCQGDGRTAEAPKANCGMGGTLTGTSYMLSVTFNAPREAFDDVSEPFFRGSSVNDLLRPMHLNARFFDMTPLPTFAAFDVMKNPEVAADLARFDAHLDAFFGKQVAAHFPA